MNYTECDERPFVAKETIERAAKIAPVSLAIASFMASHTLRLMRDPHTNRPISVVTEKSDEDRAE